MPLQPIVAGALAAFFLAAQTPQQPANLPDSPAPQQNTIPDAPTRQTNLPTSGVIAPAPGAGAAPGHPDALQETPATSTDPGAHLPASRPAAAQNGEAEPEVPASGQGAEAFTLRVQTNFIEVPFTVKDSKGQLVPGLTWRDVRVYENNLRQQMALFTVDPFPLSVAIVIDQSVAFTIMSKINNSLSALQGAFTPYDEVAVFTYNNNLPTRQTDFTAAQSPRLTAVLEQSKSTGRDGAMNYNPGPLGQNININNNAQEHINPLTNVSHGTSQSSVLNVPKEVHTLNDAILEAAKATTHAGKGRRRLVYVIGGGQESGSQAKIKDVIKYCQTNKVAVYSTLVHDIPTIKGEGFLDRIHLPFQMRDNVLPLYAEATGGQVDPEYRQGGVERSFQKITEQVRTQYTVGYYSHESQLDGKYRKLEIKIDRPNLTVIAKQGYYPTASDYRPAAARAAQ